MKLKSVEVRPRGERKKGGSETAERDGRSEVEKNEENEKDEEERKRGNADVYTGQVNEITRNRKLSDVRNFIGTAVAHAKITPAGSSLW